ncbi:MAG: flagellar hook-associated protein 3 [Pseudomonadales bacterium]|nr:flagellar hook-associated protein 3 [Pseudomonadales bacterium]
MRVSSFQVHSQAANQIQLLAKQTADTQQQISHGKRLVNPADDPVGAARVINLNQEMRAREQFLKNADAADVQLALEDSVLDQVSELIHRVQELTLQAASGIRTSEDREFLASEISARFEELLSLANTRNPAGQFLFSGYKGEVPPFELDGQTVNYHGDEGIRQVQIDRTQYLTLNDSGSKVFMDISAPATNVELTVDSAPSASLTGLTVSDQELLDEFYPDEIVIEFRPEAEAGGAPNYTVKRSSDGRPLEGMVNVAFLGKAEIDVAGVSLRIDGAVQPGERFVIATNNKQSLFETVNGIATGLQNIDASDEPEAFQSLIDKTIAGLNAATSSISRTRADIGARFNSLEAVQTLHEDVNLQLEGVRSSVEDLDFAEAVSDLAYQSFVLEAAQQSFVRIKDLSLFNRL